MAATRDYDQFRRKVARFVPSDLLPRLAELGLLIGDDHDAWKVFGPWSVAATARDSIVHGRRRGWIRAPSRREVIRLCRAFDSMGGLKIGPGSGDATIQTALIRYAYERVPYLGGVHSELQRTRALFLDSLTGVPLRVATAEAWTKLLGASLDEAVGIGWAVFAGVAQSAGFFHPGYLDVPYNDEFTRIIPKERVMHVVDNVLSTDFEAFALEAERGPALAPGLSRLGYNPLQKTPLVVLPDGRRLAPVPRLVLKRFASSGIYFAGLEAWGTQFTEDLGLLFEHYVGRQLRSIPGATVMPEITYKSATGEKKSIDWFVVFDDRVLLVEAKTTRLPIGAQAGDETLPGMLDRTLGKSFRQIDDTEQQIRARAPEFGAIPADRPRFGVVATLEPYYLANLPPLRQLLPEPALPTLVMSASDIEKLVAALHGPDRSKALSTIFDDTEGWGADSSLAKARIKLGRNPVLDDAGAGYTWSSIKGDPSEYDLAQRVLRQANVSRPPGEKGRTPTQDPPFIVDRWKEVPRGL